MDPFSRHIFRSLLPYSMSRRTRTITVVILALIVGLIWNCEKKEKTPPQPKATEAPSAAPQSTASLESTEKALAPAQGEGSTDCCEITANPEVKGRMGRLIVLFPEGGKAGDTRVDVFHPVEQKSLASGYGNQTVTLLPGIYDVDISKKRLTNVPVKSGHDTRVKVGLLRITAGKDTRIDITDAGKQLTGGYGDQVIGLPVGAFHVLIAGQTEGIEIEDGKVTEF